MNSIQPLNSAIELKQKMSR